MNTLELLKDIVYTVLKVMGYDDFISDAYRELERIYSERPKTVELLLRIIYMKLKKYYESK